MINKMAKCVVYKLWNKNQPDDYYIGATIDFNSRIRGHRYHCNNPDREHHNLKVYKFIRDNGGIDNWTFEILFLFDNEDSMKKREAKLQRELKPSLNTKLEMLTEEERLLHKTEYMKNYDAQPENIERVRIYRAMPENIARLKALDASPKYVEKRNIYRKKPENIEKKKATDKAYRTTEERKAKMKVYQKEYDSKPENIIKKKARDKASLERRKLAKLAKEQEIMQ